MHMVYSPLNEHFKNVNFSQRYYSNFRRKIKEKWATTGTSIVMQIEEWLISRKNTGLYGLVSKLL